LSKTQHTTNFTLKPNKIEVLELLENVHLPHTDSYNLHNEHKTRGAQSIGTKTKDHRIPEILQQIMETQYHAKFSD
jgi:hypothetical protein